MSERYLNTEQARQLAVYWARAEPIVRIFATSALGNTHLVEDVVQEVASIATEKFETYDPDQGEFSRWALGIARFRIAKNIRSKTRDRHVFSTEMISELASVVADLSTEVDERKSALKHCVAALKGRSRRILEMRYQWGRQVQQIAEELGMTRVAVSGSLLRTRRALGKCIEKHLKQGEGPA
ncbi:MAG: sigma-70 family RNA polymerase sigma factor [Planctomycetota bacterium]